MVEEYSAKPEGHDPREASSYNCIVMLGHFLRSEIKPENDPRSEPVETSRPVSAWRTPNAHLHIDDGSMGGGGPITHEDIITFDNPDPNHPEYPDFETDFKNGGYFANEREDIFHYCILCHDCWAPRDGEWTLNRAGRGEGGAGFGGDDFIVTKRATKVQNTFMHELGHNLGLGHTNGQPNEKDSVMYTPSSNANKLDYFSTQWSALMFDEVDDWD